MLDVPPSWMIKPYSWNLALNRTTTSAQSYGSSWRSQCQFTWRAIASQQCWDMGISSRTRDIRGMAQQAVTSVGDVSPVQQSSRGDLADPL
jgi:hypothetical protein